MPTAAQVLTLRRLAYSATPFLRDPTQGMGGRFEAPPIPLFTARALAPIKSPTVQNNDAATYAALRGFINGNDVAMRCIDARYGAWPTFDENTAAIVWSRSGTLTFMQKVAPKVARRVRCYWPTDIAVPMDVRFLTWNTSTAEGNRNLLTFVTVAVGGASMSTWDMFRTVGGQAVKDGAYA